MLDEQIVTLLRAADDAASVAHDFIWGRNEVTQQQASDAIWEIHNALRLFDDDPEPGSPIQGFPLDLDSLPPDLARALRDQPRRDPRLPPQGFAADSDPPYGDDSGPENPAYEPIRLPWECVEDDTDARLGTARVLDADNGLVCETTPRRARLIVAVVNRHASGWDV